VHVDLLEEAADREHTGLMVALVVPPHIADSLAVDGGESPSDLHVTLSYCKDADPDPIELARLITRLDEEARASRPLRAKIGGSGRFLGSGGSDGKEVVYASVDAPGLDPLRAAVCNALAHAGIEKSYDHGYTPHITLKYVDPGEEVPLDLSPDEFVFEYLILARGGEQIAFELSASPLVSAPYMESAPEAGPLGVQEGGEFTRVLESDGDSPSGSKWRVVLIRAGTSGNRVHYSEECLRRAVPLFEGVRAYADHPTKDEARSRPERSVRDIVGWYDNVEWDEGLRAVTADFNILKAASWLREGLLDAWERGKPDLFGFSINAEGTKSGRVQEGGVLLESIDRVRSTDVVTVPGAGGRVIGVLESGEVDGLTGALQELRVEVLESVRALLLEKWNTAGKKLSAAHRASISAALKGKGKAAAAGKGKNSTPKAKGGEVKKKHKLSGIAAMKAALKGKTSYSGEKKAPSGGNPFDYNPAKSKTAGTGASYLY
jgi:2'-5' RNA ligase